METGIKVGLLMAALCGMGFSAGAGEVVSVLETVDVETGVRTVVRTFSGRVEAPNWTRDGRFLIYNSAGRLYRIPVEGGEGEPLDLGFATHCNNDHVLSFDGRSIAVSNDPVEDHRSRIYTAPLAGGSVPRLVTPMGASYLHGWSPDGKWLCYCAMREADPRGDVYAIPVEGGEEVRLTAAEGLDDGPEYSPCGRYIWFNSMRSGLMQVWRMKSDGSEQTQMTHETERNCWFPHVSPDNEKVVYIAYRKGDVQPGEHLADKHVELRLMPAAGGEARTLVALFGGQGTINVNSWAPDSRRLAFVSYRLGE